MATKDNLKILDMDEHLRPTFEKIHSTVLDFCKAFDLTLDLATSDVVMYLENRKGDSICIG